MITVSLLPVWKMYFALPMDKGAFNLYLTFIHLVSDISCQCIFLLYSVMDFWS